MDVSDISIPDLIRKPVVQVENDEEEIKVSLSHERDLNRNRDAVTSMMFAQKRTEKDALGVVKKKQEVAKARKKETKRLRKEAQQGTRFKPKVLTDEPEFVVSSFEDDIKEIRKGYSKNSHRIIAEVHIVDSGRTKNASKTKGKYSNNHFQQSQPEPKHAVQDAILAKKREDKERTRLFRQQRQEHKLKKKEARDERRASKKAISDYKPESKLEIVDDPVDIAVPAIAPIEDDEVKKEAKYNMALINRCIDDEKCGDRRDVALAIAQYVFDRLNIDVQDNLSIYESVAGFSLHAAKQFGTIPREFMRFTKDVTSLAEIFVTRDFTFENLLGKIHFVDGKYVFDWKSVEIPPEPKDYIDIDKIESDDYVPPDFGKRRREAYDEEKKEADPSFYTKLFNSFNAHANSAFAIWKTAHGIYNEVNDVADIVMSWAFSVFLLSKARTKADKFAIFYIFQGRFNKNVIDKMIISGIATFICPNVPEDNKDAKEELTPESFLETFDMLADAVSQVDFFYSSLWESPFIQSARKLLILMTVQKILPDNTCDFLSEHLGEAPKMSGLEMMQSCISSLNVVMKGISLLAHGTPLYTVLYGNLEIRDNLDKAKYLLDRADLTYEGPPVEGWIERTDWVRQAAEVLTILHAAEKNLSKRKALKANVQSRIAELEKAIAAMRSLIASSARVAPVVFATIGKPGAGKTQVLEFEYRAVAESMGIPYYPSIVFHKNATVKHWDGYNPEVHRIIRISEPGCLTKEAAFASDNSFVPMFLSLADSAPFNVEMADLSGKGKVYARPIAIILDSNYEDLGFSDFLRSTGAVKRRIDYINVDLHSSFKLNGTNQIDPVKASQCKDIMEPYKFHHYYFNAVDVKSASAPITVVKGDARDLFKSIKSRTVEKIMSQQMLGKRWKDFKIEDYKDKDKDDEYIDNLLSSDTFDDTEMAKIFAEPIEDYKEAIRVCVKIIRQARDPGSAIYPYKLTSKGRYWFIAHRNNHINDPVPESGLDEIVKPHIVSNASLAGDILIMHCLEWLYVQSQSVRTYLTTKTTDAEWLTFSAKPLWCIVGWHFIPSLVLMWIALALAMFVNVPAIIARYVNDEIMSAIVKYLEEQIVHFKRITGKDEQVVKAVVPTNVVAVRNNDRELEQWALVDSKHYQKVIMYSIAFTTVAGFYWIVPMIQKQFFQQYQKESQTQDELKEIEEETGATRPWQRYKTKALDTYDNVVTPMLETVSHTAPAEDLGKCRAMVNNLRAVKVKRDDGNFENTHILGLKGPYALINSHALAGTVKTGLVISIIEKGKDFNDKNATFSSIHVTEKIDIGFDRTIIMLSKTGGVAFADITHHFLSAAPAHGSCFIGGYSTTAVKVKNNSPIAGVQIADYYQYDWPDHGYGKCGVPLFMTVGTRSGIVGIHSIGSKRGPGSIATITLKTDIRMGIDALKDGAMFELASLPSDEDPYDRLRQPVTLEPKDLRTESDTEATDLTYTNTDFQPHKKSIFYWHGFETESKSLGPISYLGTFDHNPSIQSSSKVERTPFNGVRELLEKEMKFEVSEEYGAPMMKGKMVGDEYIDPRKVAFSKLTLMTPPVDGNILNYIIRTEVARIYTELVDRGLTHLAPYRLTDVINGSEFDPYLRKVNVKTSSGYGFRGIKEPYMPIIDEKRDVVEQVKIHVIDNIRRYARGEMNLMVFKASLKDEPRLVEKIKCGKTRMFYASSMVDLIISKMYLDPWYTLYMEFPDVFKCAAGIDTHRESHKYHDRLVAMGDRIIEWDYSNYDQTIPFEIKRAAMSINYHLMDLFGYNEKALAIVRGIMTDMLYPIIELDGDLFIRAGLQPSGSQATMQVNSDCSRVAIMYVWLSHPPIQKTPIWSVLHLHTYGDDVQASLHESIGDDDFNTLVAKDLFKELLGMSITPAYTKGGDMVKFVSIEETTFLKRSYRYHKGLKRIVGVLNLNSVVRSFEWFIRSDSVSSTEQWVAMAGSALYELFIASLGDDDLFLRLRSGIIDIFVETGLYTREFLLSKFPSLSHMYTSLSTDGSDSSSCIDTSPNPMDVPDNVDWIQESGVSAPPDNLNNIPSLSDVDRADNEGKQEWSQDVIFRRYVDKLSAQIPKLELELKEVEVDGIEHVPLSRILKSEAYVSNARYRREVTRYLIARRKLESAQKTLDYARAQLAHIRFTSQKPASSISIEFQPESQTVEPGDVKIQYASTIRESARTLKFVSKTVRQVAATADGLRNRLLQMAVNAEHDKPMDTGDEALETRSALVDLRETLEQCVVSLQHNEHTYSEFAQWRTESGVGDMSSGAVINTGVIQSTQMIMGDSEDKQDIGHNPQPVETQSSISIEKFIQRPIQIYSGTISAGDIPFFELEIWKIFFSEPSVRAKLRNVSMIKADMELTINITGNMFSKALIFFTFVPSIKTNKIAQLYLANLPAFLSPAMTYFSGFKGTVMVDLKANRVLEMTVPFICPQRMARLYNRSDNIITASTEFDDIENLGSLIMYTPSEVLASIDGNAPAHITIMANLVNVEYGIPTSTLVEVTTESKESTRGPVTRGFAAVRELCEIASMVPFLKALATPAAQTLGMAEGFAEQFGFSNPVTDEPPHLNVLRPMSNGANTTKMETSLSFRGDPTGALGYPNFLPTLEDEMSYASICGRPSYLDSMFITTDDPVSVPLWRAYVHPQSVKPKSLGSEYFIQPTNVGYCAQPFDVWRGEMVYTFVAACAQSDRCKVLITIEPSTRHAGLIGSTIDLNKTNAIIWDIQESNVISICVDWCQPKSYYRCLEFGDFAKTVGSDFTITADLYDKATAVLTIAVLNPATTPNNSDIPIHVFAHGKEMMFQRPSWNNLPNKRAFNTESQATTFGPTDISCFRINPTSGQGKDVDKLHYGEHTESFRSWLHRMGTYKYYQVPSTPGTAEKCLKIIHEAFPVPMPYVDTSSSLQHTLWGYLSSAYLGYNGSVIWRFFFDRMDINDMQYIRISIKDDEPSSGIAERGISWSTDRPLAKFTGTVTTFPRYNPAIDIEIPFISNMLYASTALNPFDPTLDRTVDDRQLRNIEIMLPHQPSFSPAADCYVDLATGDDFNFLYYLSAPPFNVGV